MRETSGFTLIELVSVVALLGILAATAVPKFISLNRDAEFAVAQQLGARLQSQLNHFKLKFRMHGARPWVQMSDGNYYQFTQQGWISCADGVEGCSRASNANNYANTASASLAQCYSIAKLAFLNIDDIVPLSCSLGSCYSTPGSAFYLQVIAGKCRFINAGEPNIVLDYAPITGQVHITWLTELVLGEAELLTVEEELVVPEEAYILY